MCKLQGVYCEYFYSFPPSAAYMHQLTGPILVQVMAWHRIGAKPLPEPMLIVFSIGPLESNFSEIQIRIQNFSFMKMHLKISSAKWCLLWPGAMLSQDNVYDHNVLVTDILHLAAMAYYQYSRCGTSFRRLVRTHLFEVFVWSEFQIEGGL